MLRKGVLVLMEEPCVVCILLWCQMMLGGTAHRVSGNCPTTDTGPPGRCSTQTLLLLAHFFLPFPPVKSSNNFSLCIYFTCLFEMQQGVFFLLIDSLNACNMQGSVKDKVGSQRLHPGLPDGRQEPRCLSHHLLRPGCTLAGS